MQGGFKVDCSTNYLMKKVQIYTDGACAGNPGPGGWGSVLIYKGNEKEISGYKDMTTNNEMELTAALMALRALKEPCEVWLYSDSAYLVNAFNKGWVNRWKENGWTRGKQRNEVKNLELWKELDKMRIKHNIHWEKVKGHSDNQYNNRCDKLATEQIKKRKNKKFK